MGLKRVKRSAELPLIKSLWVVLAIATFIFVYLILSRQSVIQSASQYNLRQGQENRSAISNAKPTSTPSSSSSTRPKVNIPQSLGRSVRVPILTYHYIRVVPDQKDTAGINLSVEPPKFESQMNYLVSQGFNTITFDTLYAALSGKASLPTKPIILTFDDGYIDFYTTAFPILRRFNLRVVSFIPTGLIGSSYYMHWDQIKKIDKSGLVSFQAHSITHPNLTLLTPDKLNRELKESKKILEAQLGKPVNTFAYPYGASNQDVWQAVKSTGYIGAVGTWFGTVETEGTIYDMPRVKIAGGYDLATFIKKVQ